MSIRKFIRTVVASTLSCAMLASMTGCGVNISAADLTADVEREAVTGNEPDDTFIDSQMEFYVELFKNTVAYSEKENVLVSPLSVMLALSMTANGTDGDTRDEMENVLAGGMDIEKLNQYMYTYANSVTPDGSDELKIANSIWIRDGLSVKKEFLQTSVNYFKASVFQTEFNDKALDDINNWVKVNTDGMIDKIIEQHGEDAVMYLINAVAFNSEWEEKYESTDIYDGYFTSYDKERKQVEMMSSSEYIYLEDENTTGFVKDYKDGNYSFVALLPDKSVDIFKYIEEFSADKYEKLMNNATECTVLADMPKFSYEYETSMVDILKKMSMEKCFDEKYAEFSNLSESSGYDLYIGEVIHKAFIEVDANGTKAGAATSVEIEKESAPISENQVRLNRPFVYMIIDNATKLPIFIGVAMDI